MLQDYPVRTVPPRQACSSRGNARTSGEMRARVKALTTRLLRRAKYLMVRAVMTPRRPLNTIALLMLLRRLLRAGVSLPTLADADLTARERLRRLRSALLATRVKPHALFDPQWYRWLNPDTAKVPPLLHYVLYGHREGRSTHPLVDPEWLVRSRPELAAVLGATVHLEEINPFLEGSIANDGSLGALPITEFFDGAWQAGEHPDVLRDWSKVPRAVDREVARGPLAFWIHRGRAMGLPPNPRPVTIEEGWSRSDASVRALLAESSGKTVFRVVRTPMLQDLSIKDATTVAEDRLILDEAHGLAHHPEALDWLNDPDIGHKSRNFALHPPDVLLADPRRRMTMGGPVVHFLHEYSSNYFHAMVEVAARLSRYLDNVQNEPATALLDDTLPTSVKELILGLLPPAWKHVMLERGCAVSAPIITYPRETTRLVDRYRGQGQANEVHVDVNSLRALLGRIDRMSPRSNAISEALGNKIFVPRNSTYRKLLNQEEVSQNLSQRGFRVHSPSGTVLEQRNAFQGIEVLVAPTGAALTNILFMQPGSRVIVLSSDHESIRPRLWDELGGVSGVRVTHVRGPHQNPRNSRREQSWHHDFAIEVADVLQAIES
jgi:hypothetical protein